ncbi:MAG: DNA-3-methyladenine glycosylase [Clostridiales bacterium]|nr:DNA-3-methyladenine glycosylase [Clostridiales bacterium]
MIDYIFDKPRNMIIISDEDFDLTQTFECGQCFRWNKNPDCSYTGIAFGKKLTLKHIDDKVLLYNTSEEDFNYYWRNYFDLSLNYGNVKRALGAMHPVMKKVCDYAPGIRILNQEPFEALISFIISQNNNIPRIKGIIDRLCAGFGEYKEGTGFAFPTPQRLAMLSEDDLAPIRSGFRAKYICDAAKKTADGEIDLEQISKMPIEEAREKLMTIKGVGPKVAECVLLYGMHRLECFPLDVWMKRAMRVYFPDKTPGFFGNYAGIAQQYIFHYSRFNLKEG